eukprot:gene12078-13322_t
MADDFIRPAKIQFSSNRMLEDQLHKAAKSNDMESLKEYLAEGVNIDASNSKGLTALHLACREGCLDIVIELISRGADIQATTKKQNTPLHVAALGGKLEIVQELITQGAEVNAQAENLNMKKFFKKRFFKKTHVYKARGTAMNGMTSLYMAAQENHIDVAKELLSHDASPNLSASGGFDPVDVAIQQKHPEMTAFLSEYGSKVRYF